MRIFPKIYFKKNLPSGTAAQYNCSEQTIEFSLDSSFTWRKRIYDLFHELGHHYINLFTRPLGLPLLNQWQWYWEELDMYLQPFILNLKPGYGRASIGWHKRYKFYTKQSPELVHFYKPPL